MKSLGWETNVPQVRTRSLHGGGGASSTEATALKLKFAVQGDFVVPSNREDVDQSSAWNQWLRSTQTLAVGILGNSEAFHCYGNWRMILLDGLIVLFSMLSLYILFM